jgi:PAS domain S-box-containing protein
LSTAPHGPGGARSTDASRLAERIEAIRRRIDALQQPARVPEPDALRALLRQMLDELSGALAEEQAAHAEAEAARQRMSNILESISDGFVALDHEARVTYMNRRAEQLLDRPREALLGRVGWDEFPELRGTVFEHEYRRATEERAPVFVEAFYPPLHGWVELHAFPTPDGLTIFFRNITGRKRAEANQRFLAEASVQLAATIEYDRTLEIVARLAVPHLANSCVLYLRNDDGTVQRVQSIHVDPELDVRLSEVLARLADERPAAHGPVTRVMQTGRAELIPAVPDSVIEGRPVPGIDPGLLRQLAPRSLIVVPLVSRGHTFGALSLGSVPPRPAYTAADAVLAEDLASRAALAIDNARLYQQARESAHARQDILHVVSHDLRNSLNATLLHVELLLDASPDASADASADARPGGRGRQQVEAIQRSARHMHRLVEDLLDVEHVETGRLAIDPEQVDPGAVLEEAERSLRPLAEARAVTLHSQVDPDVPSVHADRGRLQQVLFNLIGNAIKFSPRDGRVEICAAWHPQHHEVVFRVADHGPGIAPADRTRIFERYWQGSRHTGGMGLGLPIAMGIVRAHGGRLWVESEPGRGCHFLFSLPAVRHGPS